MAVGRRLAPELILSPIAAGHDMTSNDAIPVPQQLRWPHRLVAATRDAATGLRPGEDGRLRIGPKLGVFNVVASRPVGCHYSRGPVGVLDASATSGA